MYIKNFIQAIIILNNSKIGTDRVDIVKFYFGLFNDKVSWYNE